MIKLFIQTPYPVLPHFFPSVPSPLPPFRRGFSVAGVVFKWRLFQFSAASGPQQKPRGSVWRGRHCEEHTYRHIYSAYKKVFNPLFFSSAFPSNCFYAHILIYI